MANKPTGKTPGSEQLKKDLKLHTIGRLYVLWGEEDYLRRYYLGELRRQLIDELTEAFNFHRLTAENFTTELLTDAVEALPMMAERSLVLVEDVDLFERSESERERLCELLSDLPEHVCLVLHYDDFRPDKRKKKLWDALEKNAVMAEFLYQQESDLRAWIVRHFRREGKDISGELCGYLLGQCGLSMTRLDGEIDKICAYAGAERIVRQDIDAVVEPTLDAVVFQISDALAQREFDRALERLHTMFKLQTDPIPIIAAIGSQMRRLRAVKVLQNEGKSVQEIAALCGVPPFTINKTATQARRLSERFCERAVVLCCETDYRLKTSYDDPERLAELLILQLAEEMRHD